MADTMKPCLANERRATNGSQDFQAFGASPPIVDNAKTKKMAIRARSLSKRLGGRLVLSGIDLDVVEGECVAITGANGAGKTTLLGCLSSMLRPSAGAIHWFGRPANADPTARRLIGVVAHESLLYPHLTLRENLVFAARMYGVRRPARRADELLESSGLCLHANRSPTRVSQGIRKRVAVARAIVHGPRILLLDEPLAGLDTEGTEWVLNLLIEFRRQGGTLCLAVHNREQVRRLVPRVLRLRSGRLERAQPDERFAAAEYSTSARAA